MRQPGAIRQTVPAIAAVLVAVGIVGCGGSGAVQHPARTGSSKGTTAPASPAGNTGSSGSFVGTASNAVVFITWTQAAGQLSGELEQSLLQGSGTQESVNSVSIPFTGTLSGSSVTLMLNQGLDSTTNLTGSLKGGELELNYPGSNGGILVLPLAPGTANTYNADLSGLQGVATRAVARAQQAANAQQQAAAAQQQASHAQQDAQTVQGDLTTLAADTKALADGNFYSHDLVTEQKDVTHTEADMQTVLNEGSSSQSACTDDGTVQDDVGTVQDDVGTIQDDQGSSEDDVATVADDLTQLKQDAQSLASDRADDPSDIPASAPTPAQISAAIGAANAAIATADKNATNALAQAKAMEATAAGYQTKADAVCGSSSN